MGYLELTLSCNGYTLRLGKDKDGNHHALGVTKIEGLESSELEVSTTDNALADGTHVDGKRILKRPIHIEASFRSDRDNQQNRQKIIRFFNPKYTGLLTVSFNGITRKIDYELEGWTFVKTSVHGRLAFTVDLMCPNPYFESMDDFGKNLAETNRQLAFPWRVLAQKATVPAPNKGLALKGQITGYRRMKKQVQLANDGDVPASIRVQFMAARGIVKNPKITLADSGKYIRIVTDMAEKDILLVDTSDRHQVIELNGENIYHRIDRMSEPFKLETGINSLEYDADEGYMNLDVRLFYTPLYLGV